MVILGWIWGLCKKHGLYRIMRGIRAQQKLKSTFLPAPVLVLTLR